MKKSDEFPRKFSRCIYCFAPKKAHSACSECGYDDGLCSPPGFWLLPGTILKGKYMIGRQLSSSKNEITYLGFDIRNETVIEIVEYFPREYVTRDVTNTDAVSCIPGHEEQLEDGCQRFFEKAKLYYNCMKQVKKLFMDFFVRNGTCYYVRVKKDEVGGVTELTTEI